MFKLLSILKLITSKPGKRAVRILQAERAAVELTGPSHAPQWTLLLRGAAKNSFSFLCPMSELLCWLAEIRNDDLPVSSVSFL